MSQGFFPVSQEKNQQQIFFLTVLSRSISLKSFIRSSKANVFRLMAASLSLSITFPVSLFGFSSSYIAKGISTSSFSSSILLENMAILELKHR